MKKLALAMIAVLVVMLPRLVDAQDPSNNGTVPYTLWLPVVNRPSIEEMYPNCPYETTLISPEDGASANQAGATFFWQNTAPMSQLQLVSHSEAFAGVVWEFTTTDNRYGVSKPLLPVSWRVRAMCDTQDGVFYGPWSEERILYWTP